LALTTVAVVELLPFVRALLDLPGLLLAATIVQSLVRGVYLFEKIENEGFQILDSQNPSDVVRHEKKNETDTQANSLALFRGVSCEY